MSDAHADVEGHASELSPAPLADHVNAGLSITTVLCLLGTGLTGNLVLALFTVVLVAPLTALATYTAIAKPTTSTRWKVLATAVAVAATAVFVLQLETLWGLVLPTVALAAGVPRARSHRPRLIAFLVLLMSLAVSALFSFR